MADQNPIDIRRLASLLDDPDEAVAISAMAELLNRESELGELPAELQESASPLMRRRIHQLQSALTMIRRRRYLSTLLRSEKVNFLDALVQVHLQWFDNDSEVSLYKKIALLCEELKHHPSGTLEEVGDAFAACGITATPVTTLKAEQLCIGVMLDEKCGLSPLWCGMICELYPTLDLKTLRYQGRFAVASADAMLVPEDNWQLHPLPRKKEIELWKPENLLQLAVMTLFSGAVNSDSFRYILTISQAFTGCETAESLGTLPYPYNPELEGLS
ncbi:MAG: hypothetical protein J6S54_03025 [Lentisphaeria bacterium]|nr:hypothetical protein [Lentisphaeria bacterium]